jgi:hypothetical protein
MLVLVLVPPAVAGAVVAIRARFACRGMVAAASPSQPMCENGHEAPKMQTKKTGVRVTAPCVCASVFVARPGGQSAAPAFKRPIGYQLALLSRLPGRANGLHPAARRSQPDG